MGKIKRPRPVPRMMIVEKEKSERVAEHQLLQMAHEMDPALSKPPLTVDDHPERWDRHYGTAKRRRKEFTEAMEKANPRRNGAQLGEGNDNPYEFYANLEGKQMDHELARLAFEGKTKKEIHEETGISYGTINKSLRNCNMEMRMLELQEQIKHSILRRKGPALKAIKGISLAATLEWLVTFFESEEHKKMTVNEAAAFVKMQKDIYELANMNAGKPTHQIEVIQRAEKDVNIVLQKLASANVEDGGDPFGTYTVTNERRPSGLAMTDREELV